MSVLRLGRWRATTASADSVTESTWIVVALGIAVVTLGLIAVQGSPVHRWLHASLGSITSLSAIPEATNPGLSGAYAQSLVINGTPPLPGGLTPSGWLASSGISMASTTYRPPGSATGTPVLRADFPQDSATHSYVNVMTAFPTILAHPVPAGISVGTAVVTVSVISAATGWPAYPAGSSHPAHLAVTYVPAHSTTPVAAPCNRGGACTMSVYGSFTTTTMTFELSNFAIAPQMVGISLTDDPQDGAFTWNIAAVTTAVTVVPQ